MARVLTNLIRLTSFALIATVIFVDAASGQSKKETNSNTSQQDNKQLPTKNRKKEIPLARPVEIQNLITEAHLAPAEFGIDALIRIAESSKVSDRRWKIEILEEAFRLTADVQRPVRRKAVPLPNIPVDTKAGYLSYAYDLKLDVLSLRCRILETMLRVDKKRTRELLSELDPQLHLQPLACEDSLVYEVSGFYATVAKVVGATFTEEERKQGDYLRFVLPYVEAISSPAQVAPVIKLILDLNVNSIELIELGRALSLRLKKMPSDDRSFSYTFQRDLTSGVYELFKLYSERDLPTNELSESLRVFLTRNLQSSRCAENKNLNTQFLPQFVKFANSFMFLNSPLSIDDLKPERIESAAAVHSYWESPESQRLLSKSKKLRFSATQESSAVTGQEDEEQSGESDDVASTESERKQAGWQQEAAVLLSELEQWHDSQETSEMDHFHQKSVLYQGLFEMCPAGSLRERIQRSYVNYLANHNAQKENRIEWFLHARYLLNAIRNVEKEDRVILLDALANSASPTLRLYADLARLQPQP